VNLISVLASHEVAVGIQKYSPLVIAYKQCLGTAAALQSNNQLGVSTPW